MKTAEDQKLLQSVVYDSLMAFADIGDKMTIHRKDFNKVSKLCTLAIVDYMEHLTPSSTVDLERDLKPFSSAFIPSLFSKKEHDSITVNKHNEQVYTTEVFNVFVLTKEQLEKTTSQKGLVELIKKANELFLFIENDGTPVDGFRFRETAIELKRLITKATELLNKP